MADVMTIVKAVEAVASRGWHPTPLYIGTRNRPPPNPNPLNIPAMKL